MTRIALFLAVVACVYTSLAYAQAPRNLGFEEAFRTDGVGGWRLQGSGGNPARYRTGTSDEDRVEGESCLSIGDYDGEAPPDWTYFHQYADAAPYRGRRVRLRAAIRTELALGAGLRLYLSGTDAAFDRLAHVDTEQWPIESSRWAHYDVILDVPAESIWINFGLTFYGPVEAWLDDVSLEVLEGDGDMPFAVAGPWNGDFETNAPGEPPWAWTVPFALREFCTVVTSEEEPRGGTRCARLETRVADRSEVALGHVRSRIDATPFRGRVVELRAWVKVPETGDDPGAAHLGLQFWSADGRSGTVVPTDQERPLRASDWTEVVRTGPVPDDAEFLDVDLLTFTSGIVFLDDVSLGVVGEVSFAGPAPLEGSALENLVAFTRLLGVIRYFHPSDQVAWLDEEAWPAFAAHGLERVESAADVEELAAALLELFASLAPTLEVFVRETDEAGREIHPALRPAHEGPSLRVTRWEHKGLGRPDGRLYTSRRRWKFARDGELPAGYRDPADPVIVDLGAGLAASVPATLFRGRGGTLPAASPVWVEPRMFSGDDRTTRLVDVVLAWNVFQHFYPYFEDVEVDRRIDWDGELERALLAAATDVDGTAFRETLARMVAALRDGHGGVGFQGGVGYLRLPVAWEWIEGRLVVVASDDPDVAVGSVVTAIDAVSVVDRLAEVEAHTSAATPGYRRRSALGELVLGPNETTCVLSLLDADGSEVDVALPYDRYEALEEVRPEPLAELEPGVRYVDISRVTDAEFEASLPALVAADAVLLDFRGYPQALSPTFLGHLTDAPLQSPLWCVPSILLPDQAELEFAESSWTVEPREPRVPGRLVFITDSRAISYAETCMQIVAHHELGPIVGEVTAGTNGNINPFELPGGYVVYWTGMRVLNQDRSRFHGVGVRPTHPAARTLAGVRAGRDELLEAALELARR